MDTEFKPKFTRRYTNLHQIITGAVQEYIKDVKEINFPNLHESFSDTYTNNKVQLYSGTVNTVGK